MFCSRREVRCDRSCMGPEKLDYPLGKLSVTKMSQHENIVDSEIQVVN